MRESIKQDIAMYLIQRNRISQFDLLGAEMANFIRLERKLIDLGILTIEETYKMSMKTIKRLRLLKESSADDTIDELSSEDFDEILLD